MNYIKPRQLRVLVNHAEPLLALGLAAALRQQADFDVLTQDEEGAHWDEERVDVTIADYLAGLALANESRRVHVARKILVMTTFDREQDIRTALEAGIYGYLLSGCSPEELITGVRTLGFGARYLCLAVAQRMADSLTREALTSRESEVLHLVASGHCNKYIATQLQIAVGTVKAHVKAIMNKLDASCRTEAVSIAAQRGLVDNLSLSHVTGGFASQAVPATVYN